MSDTRVEEAVYEAVYQAIRAGWSAARFKEVAAEAWDEQLREDSRAAVKELSE